MKLAEFFKFFETYDLTLVVVGLGILGIATLLHRFDGRPFSFPIPMLLTGFAIYKCFPTLPAPHPVLHDKWILHLTELGVIVSIMGVGLKIDRDIGLRSWSSVWRLLGITMIISRQV